MHLRNAVMAVFVFFLAACSPMTGEVRDATTGALIAGANVELEYSPDPSGFFIGTRIERTTTDAEGRFSFRRDSGFSLTAISRLGDRVRTSPCGRSPFTIYLGGPNQNMRFSSTLVLSRSGEPQPKDLPETTRMHASDLGLTASRIGEADMQWRFTNDEGLSFVPGTGAVPVPPEGPYPTILEMDFQQDCGWIFVRHRGRIAAIVQARPTDQLVTPGGYEETSLMYAALQE